MQTIFWAAARGPPDRKLRAAGIPWAIALRRLILPRKPQEILAKFESKNNDSPLFKFVE
jgi:hypothetical protein